MEIKIKANHIAKLDEIKQFLDVYKKTEKNHAFINHGNGIKELLVIMFFKKEDSRIKFPMLNLIFNHGTFWKTNNWYGLQNSVQQKSSSKDVYQIKNSL